jgi:MYXO-CTERM domain-containing protein
VIETARPTFFWAMSDDLTDGSRLEPTLTAYRLPSGRSDTAGELREELRLEVGTIESDIGLDRGNWRVILTVRDEAGNEASDSQVFTVDADAPGGCACRLSGGANPAGSLLVLLGVVMIRIRRRA